MHELTLGTGEDRELLHLLSQLMFAIPSARSDLPRPARERFEDDRVLALGGALEEGVPAHGRGVEEEAVSVIVVPHLLLVTHDDDLE